MSIMESSNLPPQSHSSELPCFQSADQSTTTTYKLESRQQTATRPIRAAAVQMSSRSLRNNLKHDLICENCSGRIVSLLFVSLIHTHAAARFNVLACSHHRRLVVGSGGTSRLHQLGIVPKRWWNSRLIFLRARVYCGAELRTHRVTDLTKLSASGSNAAFDRVKRSSPRDLLSSGESVSHGRILNIVGKSSEWNSECLSTC